MWRLVSTILWFVAGFTVLTSLGQMSVIAKAGFTPESAPAFYLNGFIAIVGAIGALTVVALDIHRTLDETKQAIKAHGIAKEEAPQTKEIVDV